MHTLVLNSSGRIHRVIPWEDAMAELLNQDFDAQRRSKVVVLEYHEQTVRSAHAEWKVPSVMQLLNVKFNYGKAVRYSRNNIYLRDRGQCQFCGINTKRTEFTLDHVVPRSKGGKTTWTNTVVCCVECNARKGSNTPAEAGMRLLRAPYRPTSLPPDQTFLARWIPGMPSSWRAYIRDTIYWNGTLENDNR